MVESAPGPHAVKLTIPISTPEAQFFMSQLRSHVCGPLLLDVEEGYEGVLKGRAEATQRTFKDPELAAVAQLLLSGAVVAEPETGHTPREHSA